MIEMFCPPKQTSKDKLITKKATKRIKFTPEEDEMLKGLINKFGALNWIKISELMPSRSAKQCRDRYFNYLSEATTSKPWTKEEDGIILTLLPILGAKWVQISHHIPGRSGSNVKNRWYKHLKKYYSYLRFIQPLTKSVLKNKTSKLTEVCEQQDIEDNESNDSVDYNEYPNYEESYKKYAISSLLI